jgi:GAF domain-containing protein
MQPPSDPAVPASPRPDTLRGAPPAVPAVLVSAVTEAAELLRGDGAMANLLEPATGELRFACHAGIADERRRDRVVRRLAIRSMAVAPLIAGDEVAGALGVFSATRDAFDAADVALVRALADHAAAAMANARLIDDLARSREALTRRADMEQALREVAARIAELRDTPSILHLIAAEAARLLGRERVFINILAEASGDAGWTWYSPTEASPAGSPPRAVSRSSARPATPARRSAAARRSRRTSCSSIRGSPTSTRGRPCSRSSGGGSPGSACSSAAPRRATAPAPRAASPTGSCPPRSSRTSSSRACRRSPRAEPSATAQLTSTTR